MMTFAAAGFAQDPCADIDAKNALYKQFTDLYPKTALADRQSAVSVAKSYVEKYGKCTDDDTKGQITYLTTQYLPPVEKGIADEIEAARKAKLYKRFNEAGKAKNWDEVYASGKEVLAEEKDPKTRLDVTILLGSIGFDEAGKNNDKYNADTVKYAQEAIKLIEGGATSPNYGTVIVYKSDKFPDTKSNALGWLNYTIAFIKNTRDKDPKGALPFYYKTTQYTSAPKNYADVYYNIGSPYEKELTRLEEDRQAKILAAGKKDTDETKAIFALQKGYADRVIDAYSRVYNILSVSKEPKDKTAKDSIYTTLKAIYAFRYQGKQNALDALIASAKTKPIVDPSTAVTPVIEVEAVPAVTTGTGVTAPANPAVPVVTKPAATVKPATKPVAATKPATKPATKKTNPKR